MTQTMNKIKHTAAALALCAAAGCATNKPKPEPPAPPQAVDVVKVERTRYVPVPPALLALCVWRAGVRPSAALEALVERRTCLQKYEAALEAIGKIQGGDAQ